MNNYIDLIDLETITNVGNDTSYIISSDEHIGNYYENFRYIEMVNKFANSHNIKVNIHCGDLLEGLLNPDYTSYQSCDSQIEHFINDYPMNDKITNYYIYGNHDLDFITHKVNLKERISSRKDFIYMGSMFSYIQAKDIIFIVKHSSILNNFDEKLKTISFQGHGHEFSVKEKRRTFYVPTLSDMSPRFKNIKPGFLVLEINGDTASISNYVITNDIYKDETVSYKVKTLGKMY